MKKLFTICEWVVFVILLSIIVVIASPFLLIKQSISSYAIASGSMEPTVKIGTLTFVKIAPINTLQKGDIIAFIDPTDRSRIILHRIYSITYASTARTFQTKGDNNKAADAWRVTSAMVKGKLIFTIPYLGYLSELLKTPLGFGIMIGVPALFFMYLSFVKIREGIKEEIEKGIAKRSKVSENIHNNLLTYAFLFFISALILATVPSIYAVNFGHVTISHISVSTAISPTPSVSPIISITPLPSVLPSVSPSISPTPSVSPSVTFVPTPSIPAFGVCPNINGFIQANYSSGMHAIVGMDKNQPGSDEVFGLGSNNFTQCYCPVIGNAGIQTNWLEADKFSKTDKNSLIASGWTLISKGADWGLSSHPYLAKNQAFTCSIIANVSQDPSVTKKP